MRQVIETGPPDADSPRQGRDAVSNRLGDGGVVVNLRTNRIFELNATGMRAWELIGDGHTRGGDSSASWKRSSMWTPGRVRDGARTADRRPRARRAGGCRPRRSDAATERANRPACLARRVGRQVRSRSGTGRTAGRTSRRVRGFPAGRSPGPRAATWWRRPLRLSRWSFAGVLTNASELDADPAR